MTQPHPDTAPFARAQQALRRGDLAAAVTILEQALARQGPSAQLLRGLVQLQHQRGNVPATIQALRGLIKLEPRTRQHVDSLAQLLRAQDQADAAASVYDPYLALNPDDANGHFNQAYNLKLAGQYRQALSQYRRALALGISDPQEIWVNMAVIHGDHLHQDAEAKDCLDQALALAPGYSPALYNLGNWHEQAGQRDAAERCFRAVAASSPHYHDALARLADTRRFSEVSDPLLGQLARAASARDVPASARINLHFALGKAYDELGHYAQAFGHYERGNRLNQATMAPYEPVPFEKRVQAIMDTFDADWFAAPARVRDTDVAPIFICGMFRSGSTLAEQILGAHPAITAGGELEYFPREMARRAPGFPGDIAHWGNTQWQAMADEYLAEVGRAFPGAERLTDKRCDNVLLVGLIKTLFPKAKIIQTRRQLRDNALSVYFQRLGSALNYANDLAQITHYYRQQDQLFEHWKRLFPGDVHTLDYDALVAQPEPQIRALVNFLELDWHPACLEFHQQKNAVKTASVWQVRRRLYQSSSGRWRNYLAPMAERGLNWPDED